MIRFARLIVILLTSITFFAVFPKTVSAECFPRDLNGFCTGTRPYECSQGTDRFCCSVSTTECRRQTGCIFYPFPRACSWSYPYACVNGSSYYCCGTSASECYTSQEPTPTPAYNCVNPSRFDICPSDHPYCGSFGVCCDQNICNDGFLPRDFIPPAPEMPSVYCTSAEDSIKTPFGCAPLDGTSLLNLILRWGVVIGGLVSLLLVGYAGFLITSATGDPKKMKAGQELLISAMAGLVLIALAIVILNFLGFTVLNLPEFRV